MLVRMREQLPGAHDGHSPWPAPGETMDIEDEMTAAMFIARGHAERVTATRGPVVETATRGPVETAEASRPRKNKAVN